VRIADGPDLEVQGDLLAHEYKIGDGKQKVAKVSKKWFRIRDSYGVQIEPDQNDACDPGGHRGDRRDGASREVGHAAPTCTGITRQSHRCGTFWIFEVS